MKAEARQRFAREMQLLLVLFVYLALLLGGFTMYQRLILAEHRIAYFQYGYGLIEALVLAKVILIGRALRVGKGFGSRPLIVPALYKTVSFSVFVLAFHVVEHLLFGLLTGKGPAEVFKELWNVGIDQILAQMIVLFVAFIPLFALWELADSLGEGTVWRMFFRQRRANAKDAAQGSARPPE